MTDGYTLVRSVPSLEAYLRLRAETGLSPRTAAEAAPALAGTWWGCHVVHDESGETAAMGRIRDAAPGDAFVSLMADPPGRPLYARYGFAEHRDHSMGMYTWLRS